MKKERLRNKISQPKLWSWIETISNTAIGLGINVYAQHVVFPWFGIYIPWTANMGIAIIFTVISVIRGYLLRRAYNWIHVKLAMSGVSVYTILGARMEETMRKVLHVCANPECARTYRPGLTNYQSKYCSKECMGKHTSRLTAETKKWLKYLFPKSWAVS